ncbi:uncharacterized protein LOC124776636 [Schistocerca piceifrons]|uniref:uncharacterized protein LOC124776636 n=1 Tax=Schistocerca piceifrons TaxID=274613 RepID=UPI001F5FB1C7|nr:uncharacterized protein LOC124776636 [Schistocerca piceifrons]
MKGVPVPDHLADRTNPRKRLCVMDTKKSGCPATFSVKCIRVHPGYSIESVYPGYSIETEGAHPNIKKKVEDTQSICEAFNIFKEWNVDMSPAYWREQAWNRWLRKHVKEQEDRETIVNQWRRVAASSSLQQYKDNLEKMKNHHVFEGKASALKYFEKQWVPVHRRWVKAFEHKGMFANINTTNGAEAMNRYGVNEESTGL